MPDVDSGETIQGATLERPEDINKDNKKGITAEYLLEEYDLAHSRFKNWEQDAAHVERKYRHVKKMLKKGGRHMHNILYSNVETLRPTLYNNEPIPDVRRKHKDKDPIGRRVSDILKRCLIYSIDSYDFDSVANDVVMDFLLPGRPIARVRYNPEMVTVPEEKQYVETPPEGMDVPEDMEFDEENSRFFYRQEEYEELEYESVTCELVQWDRFKHGDGRRWEEVEWISFDHHMTRDELVETFGKRQGEKIEMSDGGDSEYDSMGRGGRTKYDKKKDASVLKKAKIIEFWHKPTRTIYFVAEKEKDVVKEEADELNLKNFFPVPKPIFAVESTSDMVPVPEYNIYKHQAEELDNITQRIQKVSSAIKVRGVYDPTLGIERIFDHEDNKMIPAQNVSRMYELGGLERAIWLLPIEQLVAVLIQLYEARDRVRQVIYEITGISDIMRGQTDPRETAKAQDIKARWGGSRIQRKQRQIQKYFRDIFRIKAEIIATKFQPETLERMSGKSLQVDGPPAQQVQGQAQGQAQGQVQGMMQPAQPIATREEVLEVLRSDVMREYRIDVETDSTIAEVNEREQINVTKFLQGLSQFVVGISPAVESGYIPPKAAKSIVMAAARRFEFGREVEDALDEIPEDASAQQDRPDPEMVKKQGELQIKQQELQMKGQAEAQKIQMKGQAEAQKMQMKQQESQADMQNEAQKMRMEIQVEMTKMQEEARLDRERMNRELQIEREEMREELRIEWAKMRGQLAIEQEKAESMAAIARENKPPENKNA